MKIILAAQCRLSSTRLPGKALLELGGKTVLDWSLASMRKVPADAYFVATDKDSEAELRPICERNGFELFVGPLEDVLERYCLLIEHTGADAVIRSTCDNPFLFYEAAIALREQFVRRSETGKCDYITWTGLPHGSGVEMFSAKSLLAAKEQTSDPYDHEHVGPALYNHPEKFECVMLPSPAEWNFPNIRTTIDTKADYRKALKVVRKVSGVTSSANPVQEPYSCSQIIEAYSDSSVISPVLCVPCVSKGKGTGHLRRCLSVAVSIGADVYIPENPGLEEIDELLHDAKSSGFSEWQILRSLPEKGEYSMVLADAFSLDRATAVSLAKIAPVTAIDEGSVNTDFCDCLLDIIPSYGISRPANISDPSFVTLPKYRRTAPRPKNPSEIKRVLVTVGGEDPADLVVPASIAFASLDEKKYGEKTVTAITSDPETAASRVPEKLRGKIKFISPVHNLREHLADFDLVVSHYGFTAFEAIAAGCGVILLGTTALHIKLAEKYKFVYLPTYMLASAGAGEALQNIDALYPESPLRSENTDDSVQKDLGKFVLQLSKGRRFHCPVCQSHHEPFLDPIVSRTTRHSFRRCHNCGMLYMAWTFDAEDTEYNETYFFDDYKKQYGKTYLDDFMQIKAQCVRRTSNVDMIFRRMHRKAVTPTELDIGCAFGPYLDAANDAGWQVFGTDASKEAVDYVQNTLHYPAVVSKFPSFDPAILFGVKQFDSVTMWYVIEHFQNLDAVLKCVSKILKVGGVFAFSTPSASGVSGKFNTQSFFENSPADHYTLWEPSRVGSILKKYGFKLVKTVSTGHHPERFPALSGKKQSGLKWSFYNMMSKMLSLGDTFEVYCVKEKDI
ncbi:MAG: methyltransferase domain-containing protein [Treponema sp.]|nr:methyltransferase domain-containing protein [Treponema sp.]